MKDLPLLSQPENTKTPRLFIAATRQNDGKTTTSIGLFKSLQKILPRVGYIKPIGQRFVQVDQHLIDEDTVLIGETYDLHTPIESMSPVAIDANFTRRYLEAPESVHPVLVDKILRAFDRSAYEKDVILIEGSGHAGVGSVFNLSNAEIARLLGAKAIIIAKGGIGKPVDEITLNKSLFDQFGVEVVGAILNKVDPARIETVREYTGKALERVGVPLLGIIPSLQPLTYPSLGQVVDAVRGRWLNGKQSGRRNRIESVVVGAMSANGLVDHIKPGVLVITPGDREDILLMTIAACSVANQRPLSGIILTRNLLPSAHVMEMIAQTRIPVAICKEESYTVASGIHSMTVKTQPQDSDKIPLIQQMIARYVDLDTILESIGLQGNTLARR
jgi:BioD-like phosphotransacetylase family protein